MLVLNIYFFVLFFYVLYFLFLFFNLTDPINLLLSLIMLLTNITAILLISGAEFIAIIFLIIYVGAIAMLILFTIMMLNLKRQLKFEKNYWYYYLIIFSVIILFFNIYKLFEFFSFFDYNNVLNSSLEDSLLFFNYVKYCLSYLNELKILGIFFYMYYLPLLLQSGLILLLGMVGPIILANQKW